MPWLEINTASFARCPACNSNVLLVTFSDDDLTSPDEYTMIDGYRARTCPKCGAEIPAQEADDGTA